MDDPTIEHSIARLRRAADEMAKAMIVALQSGVPLEEINLQCSRYFDDLAEALGRTTHLVAIAPAIMTEIRNLIDTRLKAAIAGSTSGSA